MLGLQGFALNAFTFIGYQFKLKQFATEAIEWHINGNYGTWSDH